MLGSPKVFALILVFFVNIYFLLTKKLLAGNLSPALPPSISLSDWMTCLGQLGKINMFNSTGFKLSARNFALYGS